LDNSPPIYDFYGKFSGKGKAKDAFVACRPEIFLKNLFLLWLAGLIKLQKLRIVA